MRPDGECGLEATFLRWSMFRAGARRAPFSFFVISAAPREVISRRSTGIVSPDHIFGTEFEYDSDSGEVRSIVRVPAGYGKVAVIEELESRLEDRSVADRSTSATEAPTSTSCST